MAPPEKPFPVSELEERIHTKTTSKFQEKARKLPKGFKLKDCELFELVQYSCTTRQQQLERSVAQPGGLAPIECFPFVRLFRRCKHGDKVFHVETTAWEGQHAWHPPAKVPDQQRKGQRNETEFAKYGSHFWGKG